MTAAPIKYDKPIVNFIAGLDATGHVTHRSYEKTSVTLHHNGGRLSLQGILDVWTTRKASAHFQVDQQGKLGQYVGVQEYAWATGNTEGNIRSISIEMANATLAPGWTVNNITWREAARLAAWLHANVLKGRPRPTVNTLFVHHHWKSTDCAGPYIDRNYNSILAECQRWYDYFTKPVPPKPVTDVSPIDFNNLEAIMALYNSPAEFEAGMARAIEAGLGKYASRLFTDGQGTADTIWDEVKAQRLVSNKADADLLAAVKENTAAVKAASPAPSKS